MKKEELLEQVSNLPDGVEVVLFDHRKNLDKDFSDGSSEGIYKDFKIVSFSKEEVKDGSIPFSALIFDNDDYEE